MAFKTFQAADVTAPAPVATKRPAPVDLDKDVLDGATIISAVVLVFGGDDKTDNPDAEAMITIEGVAKNGHSVQAECGRHDMALNTPRVRLGSIWAYAEAHKLLLYLTDRQGVTNAGNEVYTRQHLAIVAPTVDRNGGGFRRANGK